MIRLFNVYQYAVPLVLFPVSYLLWLGRFDGNHKLVLLALSLPVVFAYVVPGIGTNLLGLWEINTRFRLGKFRPHHGFVFGTATSLFALICVPPVVSSNLLEVVRSGFVLGSVLAFWNWLYDIYAIKSGFILVYTRKSQQNLGAEAIATDYAPVLFGVFGMCYGATIRLFEQVLWQLGRWDLYWIFLLGSNLVGVTAPVIAFVCCSYLRNGVTGLKPHTGG